MSSPRKPIVIGKRGSYEKHMWTLMIEFQKEHDVTISVTDPYLKDANRIIDMLIRCGLINEHTIKRWKGTAINDKDGSTFESNFIRIEKIGQAKLW